MEALNESVGPAYLWLEAVHLTAYIPTFSVTRMGLVRCIPAQWIDDDTFKLCIKCDCNLSRIIRINRSEEQKKKRVKQQLLSKLKFVSNFMLSSLVHSLIYRKRNTFSFNYNFFFPCTNFLHYPSVVLVPCVM